MKTPIQSVEKYGNFRSSTLLTVRSSTRACCFGKWRAKCDWRLDSLNACVCQHHVLALIYGIDHQYGGRRVNFFWHIQACFLCWFSIMDPPDLRYIVKATIVRYLACSSDISRDHLVMLEYFRGWGQGVFGEEILSQIIEDFPSQLTDELLTTLVPPHLRHLKLTNCSGLSCSGLNMAIAK